MSLEAKASAKVGVSVLCEQCRNVYDYPVTLSASRRSITESRSSEQMSAECASELKQMLTDCQSGKHLGVHKCRKCSHVQSWMLQAQEDARQGGLLLWSLFLSLITSVGLYNVDLGFRIWNWLWIVVFAALAFLFNSILSSASTAIRGSKPSTQRLQPKSRPLEVRLIGEPDVWVVRETVE